MKIVCDNCATKYSIADEKVKGKVFKIRCKKCSHIIVVRGGEGAAAAHEPAHGKAEDAFPGDDPATVAQSRPPVAAAGLGTGEAVWHLVIDREQIGPLTAEEVRAKFAAKEIDVETYGWREGFADWLRLGSIDDFKDLGETQVPGPSIHEGATRRTDTADLFATAGASSSSDDAPAAASSSGDLFGGQNSPGAPTAETSMPANDLFSGGGGSAALFSAPQAAAAPAARGRAGASPGFGVQASSPEPAGPPPADGGGGKLTGQRSESSVLFSLNNLQALASGGGSAPAAAPKESRPGFASSQSEGSGLIDIRAMAASTLASSPASPAAKPDEPPSFAAAPLFSPMAAPILMPSQASGPPKWIWALLGIGVLAVVGIIVVGVLLLTKKPEIAPVAVNTAPAAVPGVPAPAAPGAPAAPAAPGAPAVAPAAPGAPAAAPAAEAAPADDKGKKKSSSKSSSKSKDPGSAPAAAAPAPAAPAAPAAKKPSGKRDELDDLLNSAAPDKPAPKHSAPAAEPSGGGGKEQLEKSDIVGGMGKIKGKVQGCYDQFKVPGLANVSVTIGRNGRVSSANVSGSFSGTPTGNCVESAVKSASFPPFTGSPQTINYPFMLR